MGVGRDQRAVLVGLHLEHESVGGAGLVGLETRSTRVKSSCAPMAMTQVAAAGRRGHWRRSAPCRRRSDPSSPTRARRCAVPVHAPRSPNHHGWALVDVVVRPLVTSASLPGSRARPGRERERRKRGSSCPGGGRREPRVAGRDGRFRWVIDTREGRWLAGNVINLR